MADNSQINIPSTSGDLIRDKDRAGVKTQIVIIDKGGNGTEDLSPVDGTDITTPTAMPTGGVGIRGWLSSIWTKLNGSLAVTILSDADNTATGTLTAALQTVILNTAGKASANIKITNTWAGTITFEGTTDGTNWDPINAVAASTSTPQTTTTVNGSYRLTPASFIQIKVTMTLWTSGTATISMRSSMATGGIFANQILPVTIISNPAEGVVSVGNSTVVNLAANAVFTGPAEDVTLFANIKVNAYSSHVSAVNGLAYQFSHDGIFWPPATDVYTIPAVTQKSFSIAVNMKWYRLVYTNGATTTTTIVIQSLYHKSDKQASSVRPQDGRPNDNDFIEELSFLMGYNSLTDAWNRIGITNAVTGGNENLIDRIKVNAALRMIDNAQPSGSKLVNLTGSQALGLDVNTGTDITSPTAMPTGGVGMRGWLSAIWTKLNGVLDISDRAARLLGVLSTGSNIIGKVGVDQTTDGTTNAVRLLAETTKVIGTVNLSPAQTLAAVTAIINALPTGANTIGAVNIAAAQTIAVTNATATNLKVQAASTQKPAIGTSVALAVTALQSLANSATVGWQSVRISNLTTLANDYELMFKFTTAATAPANDKAIYIFVIPWYTTDGGTTWFAASGGTATLPSGTDATYTIASLNNFILLGVLNHTTTSATEQGVFLLSNAFGNKIPDAFSLCVVNFSGAALATACQINSTPLNDILI